MIWRMAGRYGVVNRFSAGSPSSAILVCQPHTTRFSVSPHIDSHANFNVLHKLVAPCTGPWGSVIPHNIHYQQHSFTTVRTIDLPSYLEICQTVEYFICTNSTLKFSITCYFYLSINLL